MDSAPLEVFISYAHEDEKLREELGKHLTDFPPFRKHEISYNLLI